MYSVPQNGKISGLLGARKVTTKKQLVAMEGQIPDLRSSPAHISSVQGNAPILSHSHGVEEPHIAPEPPGETRGPDAGLTAYVTSLRVDVVFGNGLPPVSEWYLLSSRVSFSFSCKPKVAEAQEWG